MLRTPLIVNNPFSISRRVVDILLAVFAIWWYKNRYLLEQAPRESKKSVEIAVEEEIYLQLQSDTKLRERHIAKLQEKPGFSHLSIQQASEVVDNMLRFTALVYDLVLGKERLSNTLPNSL